METYQREVVALIAASGARVAALHPHRLAALWREYSQHRYACGWAESDREEVCRFVVWANHKRRLPQEIAARIRARDLEKIRVLTNQARLKEDGPIPRNGPYPRGMAPAARRVPEERWERARASLTP